MMLGTVYLFLNIGTSELMLIFFVALLLFGGDKMPGIARTLGRGIRDFKNASEDVKREINSQINSFDEKRERKSTPALTAEEHPVAEAPSEEEQETENEHLDIVENLNEDNNVGTTDVSNNNDEQQPGDNDPDLKKPANTVEYKS